MIIAGSSSNPRAAPVPPLEPTGGGTSDANRRWVFFPCGRHGCRPTTVPVYTREGQHNLFYGRRRSIGVPSCRHFASSPPRIRPCVLPVPRFLCAVWVVARGYRRSASRSTTRLCLRLRSHGKRGVPRGLFRAPFLYAYVDRGSCDEHVKHEVGSHIGWARAWLKHEEVVNSH